MTYIEFNDGEVALGLRIAGDKITWGEHKYADPQLNPTDRVLVQTKSGNMYVLAEDMIINMRTGGVFEISKLEQGLPDVTIGEQWNVPGMGSTSDVDGVLLRWKIAPGMGEGAIDKPSPFVAVERLVDAARTALDARA